MAFFNNMDLVKEKKEYVFARFKTLEGWVDFLIGNFIWSWIIVNFNSFIFNYIRIGLLSFIKANFLNLYFSYLVLGFFYTLLGLGITMLIVFLFNKIRRRNG